MASVALPIARGTSPDWCRVRAAGNAGHRRRLHQHLPPPGGRAAAAGRGRRQPAGAGARGSRRRRCAAGNRRRQQRRQQQWPQQQWRRRRGGSRTGRRRCCTALRADRAGAVHRQAAPCVVGRSAYACSGCIACLGPVTLAAMQGSCVWWVVCAGWPGRRASPCLAARASLQPPCRVACRRRRRLRRPLHAATSATFGYGLQISPETPRPVERVLALRSRRPRARRGRHGRVHGGHAGGAGGAAGAGGRGGAAHARAHAAHPGAGRLA